MGGALVTNCGVSIYSLAEQDNKLTISEVEFAIDDISDIVWNPSSFANLAISSQKKQLVLALAKAHLGESSDHTFDDFVSGKGKGLILLLQ